MKKSVRNISLLGIFTAFTLVFLYISVIFPTGQVGFIAVASLFGIAAVVECGLAGGIFVFVASSILGLLITPGVMTIYIPFFGYYPVVKALAEKSRSRIFEWVIKIAVFNIALVLMLQLLSVTVFDFDFFQKSRAALVLALNAVFIIFDFGVSRLIFLYTSKISPKIKRN